MTRTYSRTIFIEPLAPVKPRLGAPCNGCGVCCSWAPCPVGVLVSRRLSGACDALMWNEAEGLYRCGVLKQPHFVAQATMPRYLRWLAPAIAAAFQRFGPRWIAAGCGCDSTLEAQSRTIGPQRNTSTDAEAPSPERASP